MIGQTFVAASVFLCAVSMLSLLAISASHPDVVTIKRFEGPAIGLACLILFGVFAAAHRDMLHAIPVLLALACVSVSAITDLQSGYVFDRVTLASICAIALASVATGAQEAALLGVAAGAGALWLLWCASGKRGIGLGDVKLAGVIGCALGPVATFAALGVAFVTGATIVLAGLALGRVGRGDRVPFAPYIAAGTVASVLCQGLLP